MKRTIFIFIILFATASIHGQSHHLKAGCRYGKNVRMDSEQGCPACNKEREQERIAKLTEDKRRQDVIAAVQKAKEEKERADALAKHEADIKSRKTEEVKLTIDMSNSSKEKTTVASQKEKDAILQYEELFAKKDDKTGRYGYASPKDYSKWIIEPKLGTGAYGEFASDFKGNFAIVGGKFAANGANEKAKDCKCHAVGTYFDWYNVIDRSARMLFTDHNIGDMFLLISNVPFAIKLNTSEKWTSWSCSAELYDLNAIKPVFKLGNNHFIDGYENECMKQLFWIKSFNFFEKEKLEGKVVYGDRSGNAKDVPIDKIEKMKEIFSRTSYTRLITYCTDVDNKSYPITGFLLGPMGEFKLINETWLQGLY